MSSMSSSSNDPPVPGEIMLFGVRVVVDSMRKSVSLNNLSQYEQPHHETANDGAAGAGGGKDGAAAGGGGGAGKDDVAPGYTSENDVVHNAGGNRERERKRGIPWTEEEHKLFLVGLQKVGKGDWRGISRNFVKTRTPTQVASHAQKYFLRRNNHNRRRRRSSLFDITTDSVSAVPMEEEKVKNHNHHLDSASQTHNVPSEAHNPNCGFSLVSTCPMTVENPLENLTLGPHNLQINNTPSSNLIRSSAIQSTLFSTTIANHSSNLKSTIDPLPLSLKLSLPTERESSSSLSSSSRHSAFQSMPGFNNGDKIISVS